jgi:Beta-L-arabinofuranosidase, GH127 catalytic domain/Beta-L-arabinofuranosidase, GH127 middle domain
VPSASIRFPQSVAGLVPPSPLRGGGLGGRGLRGASSPDLSPPAPLSEAERGEKTRSRFFRSLCFAGLFLASPISAAEITVVDKPPVAPANSQYVSNRKPLQPSGLVRLPPGSVKPDGWLKAMLRLQADGFHGRLPDLSPFLKKDKNAWLAKDGRGEQGWEEVPYWLKGYLNCAYALNDEAMIKEAHFWVEGALNSQQADGWFGPGEGRKGAATDLVGKDDLWPNMIMLFIFQDYFEKTGDKRVLEAMRKYFKYLQSVPENKFLAGYWPAMRAGDQLYSLLWYYNRTGEEWVLDLAHKTHRKAARWDTGLINRHNVNIAQGFREPSTYWMLSGKASDLAATEKVWREVRDKWGRVPGGMFGSDENCRDRYTGPRQMIETCGMVEEMLSDELMIAITGDPVWAERCEDVAFNSLPAAFTADMKALRYLTAPNMPQSDHGNKAPGIQNGGDMLGMNPHGHRCCQHNAGHGWPYFNHHLWYATAGDGLAAYMYAPCTVTAKVAGGVEVTIEESGSYPFYPDMWFRVKSAKPARFSLYLRIPTWCDNASIEINGKQSDMTLPAGKVACIDREWKSDDRVKLSMPTKTKIKKWADNNTVSIVRGPLTFSLEIKEKYVRYGGSEKWPAYDILPDSPWNYGLEFDPSKPIDEVLLQGQTLPEGTLPFTHKTYHKLSLQARRIPGWTLDKRGLVNEVVHGPIKSSEPLETITLIPMGCCRLRITAFPLIDNAKGKEWPPRPKLKYATSASHCFDNDTPDALCDDVVPKDSNDHGIDRFTWWPRKGSVEWVQYDFDKPMPVSSAQVYWFDDTPTKGGCKLPKSWRLLYRDGKDWKPVAEPTGYVMVRDSFCEVKFKEVTTSALRLEVQLEKDYSGGILEWRAGK